MKKLIVLNHKMTLEYDEVYEYIETTNNIDTDNNLIICPSNIYLENFINQSNWGIGAQNVSEHTNGNLTGEISTLQLKSLGVEYCLVGHYERVKNFNETPKQINKKLIACLESNIMPIVCFGETGIVEDAIKDLVELSISTTKTSNSIKAVANVFYASSGVKTYEYSIDGVNYITSDTNVYTFNNLESNKTYKVYVKVTTNNGGSAESSAEVTTDSLSPATFKEVNDKVLINYPTTTGLYKTGDSEYKEGNMTSDSGTIIAKVTDGIKTVYSSYNRVSA